MIEVFLGRLPPRMAAPQISSCYFKELLLFSHQQSEIFSRVTAITQFFRRHVSSESEEYKDSKRLSGVRQRWHMPCFTKEKPQGRPMNTYNKAYKVVIGYDFTVQAEAALDLAVQSAEGKEHPELHAIFASTEHGSQAEVMLENSQKELSAALQKALEGFNGAITFYAHARQEAPAKAILRLAAEIEADAIFVGTHNRRGLSRLVMGSVAEQVMRLASCSVTVSKERSYINDKNDEIVLLEPPCERCVAKRQETNGEKWWCDTHAKPYHAPHRYSYQGVAGITRSNTTF
jgi:nucleotide-binding universal stress UspA family protein